MTNGRTDGEMDEILFMRVANSVKRNRNKLKPAAMARDILYYSRDPWSEKLSLVTLQDESQIFHVANGSWDARLEFRWLKTILVFLIPTDVITFLSTPRGCICMM